MENQVFSPDSQEVIMKICEFEDKVEEDEPYNVFLELTKETDLDGDIEFSPWSTNNKKVAYSAEKLLRKLWNSLYFKK